MVLPTPPSMSWTSIRSCRQTAQTYMPSAPNVLITMLLKAKMQRPMSRVLMLIGKPSLMRVRVVG